MFTVGKSPNISGKTKENSKLNNGGFNKWLEILCHRWQSVAWKPIVHFDVTTG